MNTILTIVGGIAATAIVGGIVCLGTGFLVFKATEPILIDMERQTHD